MGLTFPIEECIFTGLPVTNLPTNENCFHYYINVEEDKVYIKLDGNYDWENSNMVKENISILRGEIFNKKWPTGNAKVAEEELYKIIQTSNAPRTPKEKLDNLFLELFKMQASDGELFHVYHTLFQDYSLGKLYFKGQDECDFYLRTLDNLELINARMNQEGHVLALSITFKGLNYQIEITEKGKASNNCFIAMSFGEKMKETREAIRTAVQATGFKPILIDETHFDSDKTINDEIIASIKKSKFCISDFTEQRDGVYFEAGYALGLGLQVIYTCREDWFKETHFDLNHFPHIVYKNTQELIEKLQMKIEAWIK